MKYIVAAVSAVNIYFGFCWLLNALDILQTSKYSQGATIVFAILFLGMGSTSLYLSLVKHNHKGALLIGAGPWLVGLIVLFITMLTSDYK